MMTSIEKQLQEQADDLLRKKGFRRDGRPRGSVSRAQRCFEERARPNPFGRPK